MIIVNQSACSMSLWVCGPIRIKSNDTKPILWLVHTLDLSCIVFMLFLLKLPINCIRNKDI